MPAIIGRRTACAAVMGHPVSGHPVAGLEGRGESEEAALADVGKQLEEALKREDAAES